MLPLHDHGNANAAPFAVLANNRIASSANGRQFRAERMQYKMNGARCL